MEDLKTKPRILFLYPGFVPPDLQQERDKHFHLSAISSGDILLPVWWSSQEEATEKLGISDNQYQVANFSYHLFYAKNYSGPIKTLFIFFFYLFNGIKIFREKQFQYIVVYGTNLTGIAGSLLKLITGAKLIIDLPGVPSKAFLYDQPKQHFFYKIKKMFAHCSFKFCLAFADTLKLMSLKQIVGYSLPKKTKQFIFHEFVPISSIYQSVVDEKYILFLGYPWYLKGVDLLIRAFQEIQEQYPEYCLKIVGHCEDRSYFENIVANCPRVELQIAVSYDKAQELIAKCSVFVLPSRTEAMGRVLLEAMACGKPVIASDADGIVDYVKDGETGLLFKKEDYQDLAKKMDFLLGNKETQEKLGRNAKKRVFDIYSEKDYVDFFKAMLGSL